MSELNKQNSIITYIFELGLIKSVDEVKEFMRENSSPYVYNCSEPKTIRFEWFLSENEKSATLTLLTFHSQIETIQILWF